MGSVAGVIGNRWGKTERLIRTSRGKNSQLTEIKKNLACIWTRYDKKKTLTRKAPRWKDSAEISNRLHRENLQ